MVHLNGGTRRAFGRVAAATAMSLVISGLAFTSASADETTDSDFVVQEAVEASATGASDDTAAIAAAADGFDADDSASAAELVDAASATDAVELEGTADEASVETGTLQPVDVTVTDAGATMSDGSGLELGISAVGDATETELVEGASVAQDVADGTDVVTRATEDGVQLVAILEDEEAAASVEFALDIPEGAALVEQEDGSIDVVVEQQVEVADPVDEARMEAEVDAVFDGVDDIDDLTDEQWAALDAIAPVATTMETVEAAIATVSAPWAVDANGETLDTSYVLDGTTLTQVIETDATTAFPVVADPTGSTAMQVIKCAGQVGLLALAVAASGSKIALMAQKFIKYIKALSATSNVVKAWNTLKAATTAKTTAAAFKLLIKSVYTLIKVLVSDGKAAMLTKKGKTAVLTASFTVMSGLGDAIAEIVGIDACVDLALGNY